MQRERVVRISDCRSAVQRAMQVSEGDMLGHSIERHFSRPRQMAMALAREFTGASLTKIGLHFRRDHTTVLHAIRKVAASEVSDPSLKRSMDSLRDVLSAQRQRLPEAETGEVVP